MVLIVAPSLRGIGWERERPFRQKIIEVVFDREMEMLSKHDKFRSL